MINTILVLDISISHIFDYKEPMQFNYNVKNPLESITEFFRAALRDFNIRVKSLGLDRRTCYGFNHFRPNKFVFLFKF